MVIAAQHLRFGDSDMAREYRERMADYASMRALDVWDARIDLQRFEDRAGDEEVVREARKRMAERIEAVQKKSVPDFL
jgi:hypothetical protein